MKELFSEPLFLFFLVAVIDFLFFLLRGLKMLRWKIMIRVLIALSCLSAGLVLLPRSFSPTMIQLTAGIVIVFATLAIIVETLLIIFYKLKRFFSFGRPQPQPLPDYLMETCQAMQILSSRRIGALIILRKNHMLDGYIDKGIPFDAQVNAEALIALFSSGSPVHDGAVLISSGRIRRVKTVLSLKTETSLPMGVGTRHRSAVGITEKTDAIALVVSEERGDMSIASGGALVKADSVEHLQALLVLALKGKSIAPLQSKIKNQ